MDVEKPGSAKYSSTVERSKRKAEQEIKRENEIKRQKTVAGVGKRVIELYNREAPEREELADKRVKTESEDPEILALRERLERIV